MNATSQTAPQRARFGVRGFAAALGLAAAALLGTAAPALAHDQLLDVGITANDTGEATSIRMTFSDKVLAVGTEILVTDASGADATAGLPKAEHNDVMVPLKAPLADGSYKAVWRVVSSDGHPIEGGFTFEIADAKQVGDKVQPLDGATEEHEHEGSKADHEHGDSGHEHGDGEAGHSHDDASADQANSWVLPVVIGGAVVLAAAVAIPLFVRQRRNAAAATSHAHTDEKE